MKRAHTDRDGMRSPDAPPFWPFAPLRPEQMTERLAQEAAIARAQRRREADDLQRSIAALGDALL